MVALDNDDRSSHGLDELADPRGRRIATVLAGAWRHSARPLEMSPEALDEITLALLRSKAAPLAWWRIRNSSLRVSRAGDHLRKAYYHHGFLTALHARDLARIVTRLRAGGVEYVLVKGPAIGLLYPERGLRPFEDLDLCVRPDRHGAASVIVDGWAGEHSPVDLHRGFAQLYTRSWDDLYARSQPLMFSGVEVRVLSPEDHLRYLCLHQLKHGLSSPLWLCDIAVALESRPQTFDWDCALGADHRRGDWVACTIGLAHQLLGVSIDDTPIAGRARTLPRWLVRSVLDGWGRQCSPNYRPELHPKTWDILTRVPTTIRQYWPSPVAATVHLGMPFGNAPRMPIQVVDGFVRFCRFWVRRALGLRPAPGPN